MSYLDSKSWRDLRINGKDCKIIMNLSPSSNKTFTTIVVNIKINERTFSACCSTFILFPRSTRLCLRDLCVDP